jgi:hypothetical protein
MFESYKTEVTKSIPSTVEIKEISAKITGDVGLRCPGFGHLR